MGFSSCTFMCNRRNNIGDIKMGYRSDVALVIHEKHYNDLIKSLDVKNLLNYADQFKEHKCLLYYWQSVKWYGADELMDYLGNIPGEDYYFIRIGEELDDNEINGDWWDNPFECSLSRSIEFSNNKKECSINAATLKVKNTSPHSTNCAKCGGQLKDPIPGCSNLKYCPICEP